MAVSSSMKVKGLKRWTNQVRAIPTTVHRRLVPALEKNATDMEAAAERDAPVRTGILKANIGKRLVDQARKLWWRVWAGISGPGRYEEGYWAHFVEFGTVDTEAQPFFFFNYRLLRSRFRGRVTRALRQGLRDAIAKK